MKTLKSSLLQTIQCFLLSLILVNTSIAAEQLIHHNLGVQINPEKNTIKVTDKITLPDTHPSSLTLWLNGELNFLETDKSTTITLINHYQNSNVKSYRLDIKPSTNTFSLHYEGQLSQGENTQGIISKDGIYLSANSYWYPQFEQYNKLNFDLDVTLPEGWKAVSQGAGTFTDNNSHWSESSGQQEIFLIAAKFSDYSQPHGKISTQVYLRQDDPALSKRYLDATAHYLDIYESLIGPYPYQKFALIENFWETGFGMPSFTLLGSRVIRFPFILHSSYPHEILHNWWGNSVYVDYAKGNWSEGLTAYLADHLIKEQQGKGVSYRQQALQKYTDYTATGKDFALTEFRSRHSTVSEAVGYGKSLMFFHMLRKKLGDDVFLKALQTLYQQQQFKVTSFTDIQAVFEDVSGITLEPFFKQWVNRVGAPELNMHKASTLKNAQGYLLKFTLTQTQTSKLYNLDIPISIVLESGKIIQQILSLNSASNSYSLQLTEQPARLDIDPEFDIFRKLSAQETPAAFTQVFGSNKVIIVLPSKTNTELLQSYSTFAQQIKNMGPSEVQIIHDNELEKLPKDNTVILIGWENLFFDAFKKNLTNEPIELLNKQLTIKDKQFKTDSLSIAITSRHSENQHAFSFIATDLSDALKGLARKLPHYHKYSYIGFTGSEPQNNLKGRWSVSNSPMSTVFRAGTKKPKASSTALSN